MVLYTMCQITDSYKESKMYREKRERDSGWESEAIGSPMLMFHEVM